MKKIILIVALAVLIVGGGVYYFARPHAADTSAWKTYHSAEFGFSIKYPPQYKAQEDPVATSTTWGMRTLVTIYDPTDTSTYEFHVGLGGGVVLQKQPIVADGEIYHTIAEYQESGTAAQMVQGVADPDGTLVTVNGVQALMYNFPAGDATDGSVDEYIFIKNDLIYYVSFSGADPNEKEMLQSISWQ